MSEPLRGRSSADARPWAGAHGAAQLHRGYMSAEPIDSRCEAWTRWQGHLVNALFPLKQCIGCSDHSGVFLTESVALGSSAVAIKLVPTDRALAELQLPRWKRAGGLTHPHLLRIWEWGGCQLNGLPHLYAVMEYADQTLAQLLRHRALTETEAREMLVPILDALAFLHGRSLVQGQLKPANILVVGDQLKLASDTICRTTEGTIGTPSMYDPPEGRHASSSAAGDVWALGASLLEALTRCPPSALGESKRAVVLPANFSPVFRDIVARCVSSNWQDRPTLTDLLAWSHGQSTVSVSGEIIPSAAPALPEPGAPEPAPAPTVPPQVPAEAAAPVPSIVKSTKSRALLTALFGALASIALVWTGIRPFRAGLTPAAPPLPVQAPGGSPSQTLATAAAGAATLPAPLPAPIMTPARSALGTSTSAPHEVLPDVPRSARRTIRGHIQVWVRVIVGDDGSVQGATADLLGPSSYFRRLAIDAARRWTFPPMDTPARRLMQIRFDFTRDGTTGRVVMLH